MLVCSGLMECLVIPLQEQIDEWKKTAVCLDKEHAHGMSVCRSFTFFSFVTQAETVKVHSLNPREALTWIDFVIVIVSC